LLSIIATIRADPAILGVITNMLGAVIAKILWWGTEQNQ
jgi:hypothetical protein